MDTYRITIIIFLFVTISAGCDGIEEETIASQDIISLSILDQDGDEISEGIIGDGESLVTLKVKIPEKADIAYRKITFKSSDGEFIGIDGSKKEKTVDNNGEAQVILKLPLDKGPLYVSAEVVKDKEIFRDEKIIDLIDVGDVLEFHIQSSILEPVTDPILADGVTDLTLSAKVKYNLDVLDKIKFKASDGTFHNIDNKEAIKEVNDSIASMGYTVPNEVKRIYFSASTVHNPSIFEEVYIDLQRAHAETILIEPHTLKMDSTTSNNITIHLQRNQGKVSVGTPVSLQAFQLNGDGEEISAGRFTGLASAFSDSNGAVSGIVFITDTKDIVFTKPIHLRVTTLNDAEETISSVIKING